jgi:hypothetical protein
MRLSRFREIGRQRRRKMATGIAVAACARVLTQRRQRMACASSLFIAIFKTLDAMTAVGTPKTLYPQAVDVYGFCCCCCCMNAFGAIVSSCKLLLLIGMGISAEEGLLPRAGDFERPSRITRRVAAAEALRLRGFCCC